MSEITWIKLKTDMFENQKIKLIEALPEGDTILVIWIKLLTYAGRTNANGFILINEDIALSVEEMAIIFSRPLNVIRLALEAFKRYGMILLHDDVVRIKNWEVYQNVEGMEKAKLQNAERNRKYRERKKLELPMPSVNRDVIVTSHDAIDKDIDIELDKEIDKESNKKKNRRKQVFDTNSPPYILADFFFKEILKNNPNHKKPNLQTWSEDIRKMLEIDNRDKKEIGSLMRWVQKDDFEMANVLSPAKLRKRYDSLVIKMTKPPKTHFGKPIKEEKVPDWVAQQKADRAANKVVEDSVTPEFEEQKQQLLEKLGVKQ